MSSTKNKSYNISVCRGISANCSHSVNFFPGIKSDIKKKISDSEWPSKSFELYGKNPKSHQQLRVSIAGCANGCSRPHIADIALIAAIYPEPDNCSLCGICQEICPEQSIEISHKKGIQIDRSTCLNCGMCVKRCPEKAMTEKQSGYRLLSGGRLGRHPALARELSGLYSASESLTWLEHALKKICGTINPNQRIASVFQKNDFQEQTQWPFKDSV